MITKWPRLEKASAGIKQANNRRRIFLLRRGDIIEAADTCRECVVAITSAEIPALAIKSASQAETSDEAQKYRGVMVAKYFVGARLMWLASCAIKWLGVGGNTILSASAAIMTIAPYYY